jgi:hypothetical protein
MEPDRMLGHPQLSSDFLVEETFGRKLRDLLFPFGELRSWIGESRYHSLEAFRAAGILLPTTRSASNGLTFRLIPRPGHAAPPVAESRLALLTS